MENCSEQCRSSLDAWNKSEFGHVGKTIATLQARLEWLELQPATLDLIQDFKSTRVELNSWLEKEDEMWR